jgi:hypothetical protein
MDVDAMAVERRKTSARGPARARHLVCFRSV